MGNTNTKAWASFSWGYFLFGMLSAGSAFCWGHFLLGLFSAGAIFCCWALHQSNKERVFKGGWFNRPSYRIPGLVFDENNFLAFCEKRLTGSKDYGPMNMVLRRGCLGDEWEPEVKLYPEDDSKDTDKKRPMNPVPIVVGKNHIILMFNTYPEDTPSSVMKQSMTRLWQVLIKHSYDGGKTWSTSQQLPVDDIFSDSKKRPIPSYCAVGPGHGIKLESGRLVVTGNIAWPKSVGEKNQPFAIVSDNNGRTWKMGGEIQLPKLNGNLVSGNECQAVEVTPNNVVINCRTPGTYPRIQCYSSDGCDTFGPSEVMQTLVEPKNGCQGSILGFSAPLKSDYQKLVLFSNPNNSKLRLNLSVRLSKDGCKTWSDPPIKVLERLGSAYSDLTGFTQDGHQKFACLFERVKVTSRNIDLIIFTIDN